MVKTIAMQNNDRYLYRAKRTDNGEWIEGYYLFCPIQADNKPSLENFTYKHWIVTHNGNPFKVDPSTICQCTGLKDKNGKLIWENDVVNCFEAECCGKISWNESEAGFYFDVLLEDGTYEEEHIYDYADYMMVIGNIFDNPELLEK